ncbi:MAG: InlB B-repeat-containing protein [Oscillospiraceae bacterium]|nr:InlB B-repeat-containing protein [Oscillospiraceae bacterium]
MKRSRLTKILSLALSAVFALSLLPALTPQADASGGGYHLFDDYTRNHTTKLVMQNYTSNTSKVNADGHQIIWISFGTGGGGMAAGTIVDDNNALPGFQGRKRALKLDLKATSAGAGAYGQGVWVPVSTNYKYFVIRMRGKPGDEKKISFNPDANFGPEKGPLLSNLITHTGKKDIKLTPQYQEFYIDMEKNNIRCAENYYNDDKDWKRGKFYMFREFWFNSTRGTGTTTVHIDRMYFINQVPGAINKDVEYSLSLSRRNNNGSVPSVTNRTAENSPSAGKFYGNAQVTVRSNPKAGYTVQWWNTQTNQRVGTGPVYVFNINANTSLQARFVARKDIKITYDANKGLVQKRPRISSSRTFNSKLNIPKKKPSRKGFKFKGWYTKKKKGKKVTKKNKVPSKNTTYFAQWTKVKKKKK